MDIKLHYTETGSGDALILLHGNGEDSTYFSAQIEHFSKTRRVIAVDTRGHGRSDRGNAPFSLKQFSEDLREFMDSLGIECADILGFSDGGNIAILFAMANPCRVRRLILNGADLTPCGVKLSVQLPIVLGYALSCVISLFDRRCIPKREMLGLMVTQPNIKREELAAICVPTLVIVGDRDMIRDSHSRKIAEAIPRSEFVRISGSHFIAAENPDEFNRSVEEFLEKHE